jgi:glucokinase
MNIFQDHRIVLSLDAGGTNLDFSAMQGGRVLGEEHSIPAASKNLDELMEKIAQGFLHLQNHVGQADAISFAFPGPADYPNGIIGDLENLPVFRGGVALAPYLQKKFNIPVFINNDGDLFTLGEALGGFLPYLNQRLKEHGSKKRYRNLIGATFGTGFGGGLVVNGNLILGDNSAAGEINRMSNILYPGSSVEESVSIRAIKRVYAREANTIADFAPEPFDIFLIAKGEKDGNQQAAIKSFKELAIAAADALANTITLFDASVVIGGGLSGANSLFLPSLLQELNSKLKTLDGKEVSRMEVFAYNVYDPKYMKDFISDTSVEINIPGSTEKLHYDPVKKIAIGVSQLGTSAAVALGAYAFALQKLDQVED